MINLPDFDLYIFDLDDTLVNTRQAYYSAQETAVSGVFPALTGTSLDRHLTYLKWLCRIFGSGQPENYFTAFVKNLPEKPASTVSAVEQLLEIYHKSFDNNLNVLDGALEYLQQLVDNQKPLALVSNGNIATQLRKLKSTGLKRFFPNAVCQISERVLPTRKKPSPYMVTLACSQAGITPDRAIFFGNIASDILAGNLAGVSTTLYGNDTEWTENAPEIARPDFQLHNWMD